MMKKFSFIILSFFVHYLAFAELRPHVVFISSEIVEEFVIPEEELALYGPSRFIASTASTDIMQNINSLHNDIVTNSHHCTLNKEVRESFFNIKRLFAEANYSPENLSKLSNEIKAYEKIFTRCYDNKPLQSLVTFFPLVPLKVANELAKRTQTIPVSVSKEYASLVFSRPLSPRALVEVGKKNKLVMESIGEFATNICRVKRVDDNILVAEIALMLGHNPRDFFADESAYKSALGNVTKISEDYFQKVFSSCRDDLNIALMQMVNPANFSPKFLREIGISMETSRSNVAKNIKEVAEVTGIQASFDAMEPYVKKIANTGKEAKEISLNLDHEFITALFQKKDLETVPQINDLIKNFVQNTAFSNDS
ncbi:MAG: hypothetical protein KBD63_06310 [Bacteriovoracaceae bacterium]|nr:hypothetical protein [Bacteriovoracaceae bacterium]